MATRYWPLPAHEELGWAPPGVSGDVRALCCTRQSWLQALHSLRTASARTGLLTAGLAVLTSRDGSQNRDLTSLLFIFLFSPEKFFISWQFQTHTHTHYTVLWSYLHSHPLLPVNPSSEQGPHYFHIFFPWPMCLFRVPCMNMGGGLFK